MRLKDVSILNPMYSYGNIEGNVSFVPMESLRNATIDYKEISFSEAKGKYTYFGNGDLLIAKVTPCFENGNIAIAKNMLHGTGFGSSEIFVLRMNERVMNTYMFYVTQASDFKDKACSTMCGVGGLKRISPLFMRTYSLYIPSILKQKQIVSYLDTKTAAIENRIAVLEKKQEVYSRLRKSIINRAVTRGLTPNVPLKDSGVDWIGVIPEHWEVRRMKDIISFKKGKTPTELTMECTGLPYLTMDYLRSREGKVTFYPEQAEGLFAIDENEILVLWDGANAGEFILSKKGYLGSTMALLCVNEQLMDKRYLYALLKGIESTSKYFANGTTIPHFDSNVLMGYSYPIPPLPEQHAIADYLDEKCAKIDAAVANIGKQIDALKRLKRALINEVVTGKRKV